MSKGWSARSIEESGSTFNEKYDIDGRISKSVFMLKQVPHNWYN